MILSLCAAACLCSVRDDTQPCSSTTSCHRTSCISLRNCALFLGGTTATTVSVSSWYCCCLFPIHDSAWRSSMHASRVPGAAVCPYHNPSPQFTAWFLHPQCTTWFLLCSASTWCVTPHLGVTCAAQTSWECSLGQSLGPRLQQQKHQGQPWYWGIARLRSHCRELGRR